VASCQLTYTVFPDGRVRIRLDYNPVPELGDMPEFGVMFQLDAAFDHLTWYGLGPDETYADRNHGAKLGVYETPVQDNLAGYLKPQECGNKTGVRWATVVNVAGRGLRFSGDQINVSSPALYTRMNSSRPVMPMSCRRSTTPLSGLPSSSSAWPVTTAGVPGPTTNTARCQPAALV
jgi:hypothetical protein